MPLTHQNYINVLVFEKNNKPTKQNNNNNKTPTLKTVDLSSEHWFRPLRDNSSQPKLSASHRFIREDTLVKVTLICQNLYIALKGLSIEFSSETNVPNLMYQMTCFEKKW